MKIPKKIKIGAHLITVKMDPSMHEGSMGYSEYANNIICLNPKLPQSQIEATFIHEIFHFMNTTFSSNEDGHRLLDSLSEQFYQVLKDNKLLK